MGSSSAKLLVSFLLYSVPSSLSRQKNRPPVRNGLPRTTKPDAENHGFGTKSVCASVARYGGELVISAEEGLFHANFFLKKPT